MFNIIKSLLTIGICILLAACPEAGSDVRTFCPTTNTLRTYVADDKIEYVVSGVRNGSSSSGTLTFEWKAHANLIKPLGILESIPVIEEKAVLLTQGINTTTFRYIEQKKADLNFPNDTNKWTNNLWAFSDGGVNYFWFNKNPDQSARDTVEDLIIGSSPIDEEFLNTGNGPINNVFEIYPMSGCGTTANCLDKFAQYSETSELYNKETVETIQGTFFNAYRIEIPQGTVTKIGAAPTSPLPIPLDFKHACGIANTIHYSGTMWLFPEIGMVKSVINCTSTTSDNYNLTYNFNYANFNMPASQQGKKDCN